MIAKKILTISKQFVKFVTANSDIIEFSDSMAFLDPKIFEMARIALSAWSRTKKFCKHTNKIINNFEKLEKIADMLDAYERTGAYGDQLAEKYSKILMKNIKNILKNN